MIKEEGRNPVKILFPKKSVVNDVILPTSVGRVPLILFPDKSTVCSIGKGYFIHDKEPVNLF